MILLILTLLDGSNVNLSVDASFALKFDTKYGVLNCPASDVGYCHLGVHVADEKPYLDAVSNLGSEDFKLRDEATNFLRANRFGAYKYLAAVVNDKNAERQNRATKLVREYGASVPPIKDNIFLSETSMSFYGSIANKSITGKSESLGELTIPIEKIAKIVVKKKAALLEISADGRWYKAGYSHGDMSISARGEIDLWPQEAGTWKSSPAGINQQYNGHPSGSLLGRVGEQVFFIGHGTIVNQRGEVELMINGSSWNSQPVGAYTVEVK